MPLVTLDGIFIIVPIIQVVPISSMRIRFSVHRDNRVQQLSVEVGTVVPILNHRVVKLDMCALTGENLVNHSVVLVITHLDAWCKCEIAPVEEGGIGVEEAVHQVCTIFVRPACTTAQ